VTTGDLDGTVGQHNRLDVDEMTASRTWTAPATRPGGGALVAGDTVMVSLSTAAPAAYELIIKGAQPARLRGVEYATGAEITRLYGRDESLLFAWDGTAWVACPRCDGRIPQYMRMSSTSTAN
jgi:hypothetical protein